MNTTLIQKRKPGSLLLVVGSAVALSMLLAPTVGAQPAPDFPGTGPFLPEPEQVQEQQQEQPVPERVERAQPPEQPPGVGPLEMQMVPDDELEAQPVTQDDPTEQIQPGVQPEDDVAAGPAEPGRDTDAGEGSDAEELLPTGDAFVFGQMAEPIEIKEILDTVREELDLFLIYLEDGALNDTTVEFPAPITIQREDILTFVQMLLNEKGFALIPDELNTWKVIQRSALKPRLAEGDKRAPTRIITLNDLKPSSLQTIMSSVVGTEGVTAQYVDALGIIIITAPPREMELAVSFIEMVKQEVDKLMYQRFEVRHIAASTARERILGFLGTAAGGTGATQQARAQQGRGGGQGQPAETTTAPAVASATLSNLPERLSLDPQGNALLLRGRPEEGEELRKILAIVDVPNNLKSRFYEVGTRTSQAVSETGRSLGLGEISVFQPTDAGAGAGAGQGATNFLLAGAGFTLYPESDGFMYRGTESQHEIVRELVDELAPLSQGEIIVYEFYKLDHGEAEDIADLIQSLLDGQQRVGGSSPLVGGDLAAQPGRPARPNNAGGPDAIGDLSGFEDVFVTADENNNQVIVKAPRRLQSQFAKLIEKLDLRRPQVYIEAQIVSLSTTDNFRFAVEVQNIVGSYALSTNFGLGTLGDGAFQEPKTINTSLNGLTTALVRSEDIPFIVNTFKTLGETKIVATPQLLIDDNEEGTVSSQQGEPTTTASQGTSTTQTSFAGFEEAGPSITLTPQISDGGLVTLEYQIELSSFVGTSSSPGVPPSRLTNQIDAKVTVPSDATIVVGGLTFSNEQETVNKIPLLGDIPLVGHLFKDTSIEKSDQTLFVFITPRIMDDDLYRDIVLNTQGPLRAVGLDDDYPDPEFRKIEVDTPQLRAPSPEPATLGSAAGDSALRDD